MFKGMGDLIINCDPSQRDFTSFGAICVITIFCIFLLLVIIASCIQQYNVQQELQQNSSLLDKHCIESYLYCFSIQTEIGAFFLI